VLGDNSMEYLRNGYAVSTQTTSYFVVYSCVAVSLACMSKTLYFPVTVVCAYDLGVARDDVEGYFCLVYFCAISLLVNVLILHFSAALESFRSSVTKVLLDWWACAR
jgi:hypothetical protein